MNSQILIGNKIKKLREKHGLSQSQLAEKVGYNDKSSIAKIEAGKVDVPQSKLVAFSKVLNTTIDYLLSQDNDDFIQEEDKSSYYAYAMDLVNFLNENPEYWALIEAFKKVKESDIDLVMQMLDRLNNNKKP